MTRAAVSTEQTRRATHYLVWQRFQMACGRKPNEVFTSASFWMYVDCQECLAAVEWDPTSPIYIDLSGDA